MKNTFLNNFQFGGSFWDLSGIANPPSGPNINISTVSLSYSSVTGAASAQQSIAYSVSNLTNPLTISIPANWEGSINGGSTWAGSYSGLTVSGTLQVRVAAATAAGSYGPSNVTFVSTGALTKQCALSATVAARLLSSTPTSMVLNGTAGAAGSPATSVITFGNLLSDITVTAPTTPEPVELSIDGTTYSNPLTILASGGSPVTLYARTTSGSTAGSVSGNITLAASGVTTINISTSGTVSALPTTIERFSFSLTAKTLTGWTNVFGDPHTAIKTATGGLTGWGLTTIATANYVPNGACAFDGNGTQAGTFFSDGAGSASAVMNNGYVNGGAYDHTKPQFEISGLDNTKSYNIRLTGSTNGGSQRITDVRVEGATLASVQTFTAKSNTANGATFTNISPDGAGKIRIWFNQDVTNVEQGHCDGFTISQN